MTRRIRRWSRPTRRSRERRARRHQQISSRKLNLNKQQKLHARPKPSEATRGEPTMVRTGGNQKGGGYGRRQHVERPIRTGTGSRSTNPGGVGQLGQMQGSHVTRGEESNYRGDALHSGRSFQPVKFGNEVALNVGKGGCGT